MKYSFDKNTIIGYSIVSFIFSLCLVLGTQLQEAAHTSRTFLSALLTFLLTCVITVAVFFVFLFASKKIETIHVTPLSEWNFKKALPVFLPSAAFIFLSWTPAFLAYYPCIMSSDFDSQISQIVTGHSSFTNHHPFLSTLEIEFFFRLGENIKSPRIGLAMLGVFHLFVMSLALGYLAATLYRMTGKKLVAYITAILMAIYPINPVMTLSTTKDVMFSVFFLLLFLLSINMFMSGTRTRYYILMIIDIAFLCSYRNNALYAIMLTIIVLALMYKGWKNKRTILIVGVLSILAYELLQFGISSYLGVKKDTDSVEMYSVLIQTMGRTYNNHLDDLDTESKEIIERLIPAEALPAYNSALSDPLKTPISRQTFDSQWRGQMGTVVKNWLKVGAKYPLDYLDGFLDLTRGYWYLNDDSFAYVFGNDLEDRFGLLYTYSSSGLYDMANIYHETKAPSIERIYENLLTRNDCLKIPVIRLLFQLSTYVWILVLSFLLFIKQKNKDKIAVLVFPIIYLATLFLGPTAYVRYAFPIMLCVPGIITIATSSTNSNNQCNTI